MSQISSNCKLVSNRALNEQEAKERKTVMESMPRKLFVVLTTRCNLECIMCPRIRIEETSYTLPYELAAKIFELLPYLEIVDWQGGEVFLLDYFKELFLKTANHSHILQRIQTNGLLIDKEWARVLSESRVNLVYSIDAVTKATYESIRCNAKFEDLLRSLELVNQVNAQYNGSIQLCLAAVVMRRNYKELVLLPDFCKRYNFSGLNLDVLWPEFVPQEDIFSKPDKEAMGYLKQAIPQIDRQCRDYNISFRCTFNSYLEDYSNGCEKRSKIEKDSSGVDNEISQIVKDCLSPWDKLYIDHDGKVYPECNCKRSIGHLKEHSLKEMWNSETMQLYRRLIKNKQADKICSQQCKFYTSLKRKDN